jgi:hypothetical protein
MNWVGISCAGKNKSRATSSASSDHATSIRLPVDETGGLGVSGIARSAAGQSPWFEIVKFHKLRHKVSSKDAKVFVLQVFFGLEAADSRTRMVLPAGGFFNFGAAAG